MKKEVADVKATPVVETKAEVKPVETKTVEVKATPVAAKPVETKAEVKPEVKAVVEPAKKRGRKSKAEIEELKAAGIYTEKKTAKKTAKKTTKKLVEKKTNVVVQWYGKSVTEEEIVEKVKAAYVAETGKKESSIKVLDVYVKPEENAAYYVVDSKVTGRVDL